jgi:hypothetical protein
LLNSKIRKAGFVEIEQEGKQKFKYLKNLFRLGKFREKTISIKRKINSLLQKIPLLTGKVSWKDVITDSSIWFVESFVEGLIANYVTHYFIKIPFNIGFIFAHGFLIKQSLSICWRLKQNGRTETVP